MSAETRAMILSAVLKQNGNSFKVANIMTATGISRQLITYHLKSLVEKGTLSLERGYYNAIDTEALIDQLATGASKDRKIHDTQFLTEPERHINTIVVGKLMMLPEHMRIRRAMLEELDESIHVLQNMKWALTNQHHDKEAWRKKLLKHQDQLIDAYCSWAKKFDFKVDKNEVSEQLYYAMDGTDN